MTTQSSTTVIINRLRRLTEIPDLRIEHSQAAIEVLSDCLQDLQRVEASSQEEIAGKQVSINTKLAVAQLQSVVRGIQDLITNLESYTSSLNSAPNDLIAALTQELTEIDSLLPVGTLHEERKEHPKIIQLPNSSEREQRANRTDPRKPNAGENFTVSMQEYRSKKLEKQQSNLENEPVSQQHNQTTNAVDPRNSEEDEQIQSVDRQLESSKSTTKEPLGWSMFIHARDEVLEALLKCDSMQSLEKRRRVVNDLPGEIKYGIEEGSTPKLHTANILDRCMDFARGLRTFLERVEHYDGGTRAFYKAAPLVLGLELLKILENEDEIGEAELASFFAKSLPRFQPPRQASNTWEQIKLLWQVRPLPSQRSPILHYVDQIIERAPWNEAELRAWQTWTLARSFLNLQDGSEQIKDASAKVTDSEPPQQTDENARSISEVSAAVPKAPPGKDAAPETIYGAGNRWAVLVGVNNYDDSTHFRPLQVCVKDVIALRERLIAVGYEPDRIHLLTDDSETKPIKANILSALKAVADATEPDDLLLFYYSGHGDTADGESYLVGHEGHHLVLPDTATPVSRIKQILNQAPARAKVIVLDACHSGADIGKKGPQPMTADFINRVFEQAEGMAILASCKQGQFSYEWRRRERSVFTHYWLDALGKDADRDDKGFVTVLDVHRHVTNGVKLWASRSKVSQTPTLEYQVAGDIILARYSPS
jgi:N-acetylmuramoyl-L-alanine amidase